MPNQPQIFLLPHLFQVSLSAHAPSTGDRNFRRRREQVRWVKQAQAKSMLLGRVTTSDLVAHCFDLKFLVEVGVVSPVDQSAARG